MISIRNNVPATQRRHDADAYDAALIPTATLFVTSLFLGSGHWDKIEAGTLAAARANKARLLAGHPGCTRIPLVYARLPSGQEIMVPDTYMPPMADTVPGMPVTPAQAADALAGAQRYSTQSNARRAARKALGAAGAQDGGAFTTQEHEDGQWTWHRGNPGPVTLNATPLHQAGEPVRAGDIKAGDTVTVGDKGMSQITPTTEAGKVAMDGPDLTIPPQLRRTATAEERKAHDRRVAADARKLAGGERVIKNPPKRSRSTGLGMAPSAMRETGAKLASEGKGKSKGKKAKATRVESPKAPAKATVKDAVAAAVTAGMTPKEFVRTAEAVADSLDMAVAVFVGVKKPNATHLAQLAAAQAGTLPEFPAWDAPSYAKGYKPRRDQVAALAKAGDVAKLVAMEIPTYDGAYALLARLRNLAVIALRAKAG